MKEELSELCDGSHIHQPLEGNLTKQAEHWPEELCHRVLRGAMRELQSQALSMAFPVEQVAEEREEVGCLDAIHDSRDLEESPMKKQKIDHDEIQREEFFEEMTDEDKMLHQKERDRKAKWLKLNKEKRIALRRLHAMMGHCSVATMTRMLKSSLASKDLLDAVPHFRCQSCEERRKEEAPRSVRPTRSKAELKFNYELAVDVFEVTDSKDQRHSILSMIDMATHYHIAARVGQGGTPSSRVCAEALNQCWFTPFGAPKRFVSDQGVHNKGRVYAMLKRHGVEVRSIGAQAPYQLGTAERHGGILKQVMYKAIHSRQL